MTTNTTKLLAAVRDWHPTHAELKDFFACLTSAIKHNEHPLGDKCSFDVRLLLAEAFDLIDLDKKDQQIEQTWADSQRRAA